MRGVFLDRESIDNGDMDFTNIKSVLPHWDFYNETTSAELHGRIANTHIAVINKISITATDLARASNLKLICVAATGTNNVDLDAAKSRNIAVCNVRNYATPSVVQHVFTLILALTTRLPQYQDAVKRGEWQISTHFSLLKFPITELSGKTLGIIGFGVLGRAVAEVARAFGMKVMVAARGNDEKKLAKDRVPLAQLIKRCDIISIHCPLTSDTQGLIGEVELTAMKPDALLINTARGGIVDEVALASAIKNKTIGGAGVDVLTMEPPSGGNPLLEIDSPNLIVTPHIAWSSIESRQRLLDEIAKNIRAYISGAPRNLVV